MKEFPTSYITCGLANTIINIQTLALCYWTNRPLFVCQIKQRGFISTIDHQLELGTIVFYLE